MEKEKFLEILILLVIPYFMRLWALKEKRWYFNYLRECRERKEKRYSIQKVLWYNPEPNTEAISEHN